MTPTMTTPDITEIDLDAVEVDATDRREELREQQARLSLPALCDPEAASELANVQSELRAAELAIEQVAMAREERERREVEAAEQAEQAARDVAAREAEKRTKRLRALAKGLDETAQSYAAQLAEFHGVFEERKDFLVAARLREYGHGGSATGSLVASFAFHLDAAGAGGILPLVPGNYGPQRPLSNMEV